MPKKHNPKTVARLAARRAEAAAVSKPKALTSEEKVPLLQAVSSTTSFSGAGSSLAALAAAAVEPYLARVPETMAKVIVDICDGKIKAFDPVVVAAMFRDYMSPSHVKSLQEMLTPLLMLAKDIFYPSTVLIDIQCGANAQTYFFDGALKLPSLPDPSKKEIFSLLLSGQVYEFLKLHASMPGVMVFREFAPGTRELLGDAIYPFSPMPFGTLSPSFSDDSDDSDSGDEVFTPSSVLTPVPDAFVNGFNRCDLGEPYQSELQCLLKKMGQALMEFSIQATLSIDVAGECTSFSFGTKSPAQFKLVTAGVLSDARQVGKLLHEFSKLPGSFSINFPGLPFLSLNFAADRNALAGLDPLKLSSYSMGSSQEQRFFEHFRKFSLKTGICYTLDSVALVRFDGYSYIGRLGLRLGLAPEALLAQEKEFFTHTLNQEDFESAFETLLSVACLTFRFRGTIIISSADRKISIAGAFDPIKRTIGLRYLKAEEVSELLAIIPDPAGASTSVVNVDVGSGDDDALTIPKPEREPLLDVVPVALQAELQAALEALKDFIGRDAGVVCQVKVASKILFDCGEKFRGSVAAGRKLKVLLRPDVGKLIARITDCLSHASDSAVVMVSIGGSTETIYVAPASKSAAGGAGSGPSTSSDTLALQAELSKLQGQLDLERAAMRTLKVSEVDALAVVKAQIVDIKKRQSDLRARIAMVQTTHEARVAPLMTEISELKARIAAQQQELKASQKTQSHLVAEIKKDQSALAAQGQAYDQMLLRLAELQAKQREQQQASAAVAGTVGQLTEKKGALTQACAALEQSIEAISAQTATLQAATARDALEIKQLSAQAQQQDAELLALTAALRAAKIAERDLIVRSTNPIGLMYSPFGLCIPVYALKGSELFEGFMPVNGISIEGVSISGQCLQTEYMRNDALPVQGVFHQSYGASAPDPRHGYGS